MGNGFAQQFDNGRVQTLGPRPGQACRGALGVNACAVQRFVGVDVADAAQELLVQQQRLDRKSTRLNSSH